MKTGLKVISTFVFVILGIFVIAFFAQYITSGTNFFETLGMVFGEKCQGSFSVSESHESHSHVWNNHPHIRLRSECNMLSL